MLLEQSLKLIGLIRLPSCSHNIHLAFLKELLDVLQAQAPEVCISASTSATSMVHASGWAG